MQAWDSLHSIEAGVAVGREIAMVIVLGGASGRIANVRQKLGRNLFDLPSAVGPSLFADWHARLSTLLVGRRVNCDVCLAIDHEAPEPLIESMSGATQFARVRDTTSNRGTAGVLRDLTRNVADDEDVLVVQASDLAWQWSDDEARALLESPADIVLSADRDLRPAGMMRIRCGILKRIPSVGFVDLKEQFLPRCAGTADIDVVRSERPRTGTLHSLRDYLETVMRIEGQAAGTTDVATAVPWRAGRVRAEAGSVVHADAVLFESVVLRGARVDAGALVVRSLIGENVIVGEGEQVVDRTLAGGGSHGRSSDVMW